MNNLSLYRSRIWLSGLVWLSTMSQLVRRTRHAVEGSIYRWVFTERNLLLQNQK